MSPTTSVLIFLKEPKPGLVKTRLARAVGKRRAAALYRAFVEDTIAWVAGYPCSERRICFAPSDASVSSLRELVAETDRTRLRFTPQADGDLGDRMLRAFQEADAKRSRRTVAIGTDCPLLGPQTLNEAFHLLRAKDLVLGPAIDGGYYLIGLRRCVASLFEDIPWSTRGVLDATLARARAARLSVALLAPLRDVDTIGDLRALRRELAAVWRNGPGEAFPRRTFRAIAKLRLGSARNPKRSR